MNMLNVAAVVIIEFARTFITLEYFNIFLAGKNQIKKIISCFIAFLATTVCFLTANNNYINTTSTIISIIIIALSYDGKIKSKVLLSILCYSIMVAVDFIVYIISADNKETWEYQILVSFISVLLFYIIMVVLRLIFKKKQKTELVGQWYILLLVSVMSVCILFEMYKEIGLSSYGILFLSTSVLIVNLLLYVFYSSMLDRYVYMQENERLRQQMHYYNMQMNANVQNDKKVRSIRHDMKHHIREINNLANLGEIEEIKKYTSDLMGDINSSKTMFDTGNITLDGILNYYYGKFEEQNIKAAFDIIVPENMGFGAMDINIIMGNLLDNAYENAVKAKESDIKVNIKYNGNMLYISVANTFDGKVNKDKDKYLSTKGEEHGYGLENIKRITEKYGGNMKIEHNDTMFVVSIIIYIAKKNE